MNERIKQPYVGVSGVSSPDTQAALEKLSKEVGLKDQGRLLALGVKAVHKTQYLDIENKYGYEWYPVGEIAFNNALRHTRHSPGSIAVAQTYLDVEHVHDATYRKDFVDRIVKRGKPWLQAIQFDMLPWHADKAMLGFLEEVKANHDLSIFLQCHKPAMDELGPTGVVQRLGSSTQYIDYLLFDSSHGTGTRLDTVSLRPFIAEAYESLDIAQTGIAIAGGLNARVVRQDLPKLVADYPSLSWDAEGQLHPPTDNDRRPLDLPTAYEYLLASADILAK